MVPVGVWYDTRSWGYWGEAPLWFARLLPFSEKVVRMWTGTATRWTDFHRFGSFAPEGCFAMVDVETADRVLAILDGYPGLLSRELLSDHPSDFGLCDGTAVVHGVVVDQVRRFTGTQLTTLCQPASDTEANDWRWNWDDDTFISDVVLKAMRRENLFEGGAELASDSEVGCALRCPPVSRASGRQGQLFPTSAKAILAKNGLTEFELGRLVDAGLVRDSIIGAQDPHSDSLLDAEEQAELEFVSALLKRLGSIGAVLAVTRRLAKPYSFSGRLLYDPFAGDWLEMGPLSPELLCGTGILEDLDNSELVEVCRQIFDSLAERVRECT